MAAWLIYLKERFPLPVYLLLAGGFAVSGVLLAGGSYSTRSVTLSLFGLLYFFGVLRLMDELKDYEKDLIAHPERPLPRGLLSPAKVQKTVNAAVLGMVAYGFALTVLGEVVPGMIFLAITVYLWLMYREFYAGHWLSEKAFLYGTTHQVILILLCVFAATFGRPAMIHSHQTLYFGLLIFGSFFPYEICRKLDPKSHPVLKTYLSVYGPGPVAAVSLALSVIAGWAAWKVHLFKLLWPAEGAFAVSLILIFVAPQRYKIVEGLASLSLLIHIWAVALQRFTGWPT